MEFVVSALALLGAWFLASLLIGLVTGYILRKQDVDR